MAPRAATLEGCILEGALAGLDFVENTRDGRGGGGEAGGPQQGRDGEVLSLGETGHVAWDSDVCQAAASWGGESGVETVVELGACAHKVW